MYAISEESLLAIRFLHCPISPWYVLRQVCGQRLCKTTGIYQRVLAVVISLHYANSTVRYLSLICNHINETTKHKQLLEIFKLSLEQMNLFILL